jgi:excisionase family DNA binding protein
MFHKYPDVVTVIQLCNMLSIGRNSAYRLIRSGAIHHIRIGKVIKIPKSAVIAFLSDCGK